MATAKRRRPRTPLEELRHWDVLQLLLGPDDLEVLREGYRLAVRVTERSPRSVIGWSERAHLAGTLALCGDGDTVSRWSDVVECGHRLSSLGSQPRAERAWAEAAVHNAGKPVFGVLEKMFALSSLVAGLDFWAVDLEHPGMTKVRPGESTTAALQRLTEYRRTASDVVQRRRANPGEVESSCRRT